MKQAFKFFLIAIFVAVIVIAPAGKAHAVGLANNQLNNLPGITTLALVPTPIAPTSLISNPTPTFAWSQIAGASYYRIQVFKGTTFLYFKIMASSTCGTTTLCQHTPRTTLLPAAYSWRVQAQVNGVWQPFSALLKYTLVKLGPGFTSNFTGDALGWQPISGVWARDLFGDYVTDGNLNYFGSAAHIYYYSTLTYSARVKRTGTCLDCSNYLIVRGIVNPLDTTKNWSKGIRFQYTNTGFFSVWKMYNGNSITIKTWTPSAAIVKGGWNVLRIAAKGNMMNFYINNSLVWSGSPSAESIGVVGLGMFTDVTGNKLLVDWATTSMTVTADQFDSSDSAIIEETSGLGDGSRAP